MALASTLGVCLLAYIGFGWAVWSQQHWLTRLIGLNRLESFANSYATAAGTLLSGDHDGDGFCDGYELYWRTDPRNPLDHPRLKAYQDPDFGCYDPTGDLEKSSFLEWRLVIRPDSSLRLNLALGSLVSHQRFPSGLRVQIVPATFARVAAAGGKPASTPLILPVAADGTFALDVSTSPDIPSDPREEASFIINNAATGEKLSEFQLRRIWPQPPVEAMIQKQVHMGPSNSPLGEPWTNNEKITLSWPAIDTAAETLLIEAARDEPGAPWVPVSFEDVQLRECVVIQSMWPTLHYHGPLKFRVVPVNFAPP